MAAARLHGCAHKGAHKAKLTRRTCHIARARPFPPPAAAAGSRGAAVRAHPSSAGVELKQRCLRAGQLHIRHALELLAPWAAYAALAGAYRNALRIGPRDVLTPHERAARLGRFSMASAAAARAEPCPAPPNGAGPNA